MLEGLAMISLPPQSISSQEGCYVENMYWMQQGMHLKIP